MKTETEELLFFSGTSYLGMAVNTDFQALIHEGISIYGTNYGSSRTSNLRLKVFEEMENYLCAWTGAAASLTMSSGFLAGQLVAQWIRELGAQGYQILYAPHTHPAVFSGLENPNDHHRFEDWVQSIKNATSTSKNSLVLVCNAVDSLNGKVHDFQWLTAINEWASSQNKQVILIADDSHGIGIVGERGSGIFSQIPDLPFVNKVVVASMGKALGMSAGLVLGNKEIIQTLQKSIFYSGASPALPAYLYAFLKSQSIYQRQLEKLKTNIAFFIGQTADLQLFDFTPAYPVFRTSKNSLYEKLLENNILISSFPYPKPNSELITRVVLSSLHTQADLAYLVSKLM